MSDFAATVYFLCFISGGLCAYLLFVAFARQKRQLFLWSAVCFSLLAINNFLVFLDIIILPTVDLLPYRLLASLTAVIVLLYAFIWEIE
jgi:Family of unknown function (DUF5985)